MRRQSQCKQIIEYAKAHGSISHFEAEEHIKPKCTRIAARIGDLEAVGNVFDHQMVYDKDADGNNIHYTRYWLVKAV